MNNFFKKIDLLNILKCHTKYICNMMELQQDDRLDIILHDSTDIKMVKGRDDRLDIILHDSTDIKMVKEQFDGILCKDTISVVMSYYNLSWQWKYTENKKTPGNMQIVFDNKIISIYHEEEFETIAINNQGDIIKDIIEDCIFYCDTPYIYTVTENVGIYVIHYYNKIVNELIICTHDMKDITKKVTNTIVYIKNNIIYTCNLTSEYENNIIILEENVPEKKYTLRNINLYVNTNTHALCTDFDATGDDVYLYSLQDANDFFVNDNGEIVISATARQNVQFETIRKIKLYDNVNAWSIYSKYHTKILFSDDYQIIYRKYICLNTYTINCFNKFNGEMIKMRPDKYKSFCNIFGDINTLYVENEKSKNDINIYRLSVYETI